MQDRLAIEMRGGLGNQLFIYSAGNFFAKSNGLQPTFFMRGISTKSGSIEGLLPGNFVSGRNLSARLHEFYALDSRHFRPRQVVHDQFGLHPSEYIAQKNSIVRGFFQNREFPIALERMGFDFRVSTWPISGWTKNFIEKIQQEDSTVVHIRRGDYLNHFKTFGVLSDYYYEQAMNRARPKKLYIVSDSLSDFEGSNKPTWAREAEIVQAPIAIPDYETLVILSHAPHLILSNSSFSWWGAYLSGTKGKKIAPATWFRDSGENLKMSNIHLENWELIKSDWENQ